MADDLFVLALGVAAVPWWLPATMLAVGLAGIGALVRWS